MTFNRFANRRVGTHAIKCIHITGTYIKKPLWRPSLIWIAFSLDHTYHYVHNCVDLYQRWPEKFYYIRASKPYIMFTYSLSPFIYYTIFLCSDPGSSLQKITMHISNMMSDLRRYCNLVEACQDVHLEQNRWTVVIGCTVGSKRLYFQPH